MIGKYTVKVQIWDTAGDSSIHAHYMIISLTNRMDGWCPLE
jgi:hypothetical protein